MKTIVAGSRYITDQKVVNESILDSKFEITELVSGTCRGVDYCGLRFAKENDIPIREFPALWNLYGKKAGPIRNQAMVDYADALIAIWDGKSKGTKDIIERAKKKNLKLLVVIV
jgi:lactate dehydrogenase-like 2-hydroxyacid dehydrogenase